MGLALEQADLRLASTARAEEIKPSKLYNYSMYVLI